MRHRRRAVPADSVMPDHIERTSAGLGWSGIRVDVRAGFEANGFSLPGGFTEHLVHLQLAGEPRGQLVIDEGQPRSFSSWKALTLIPAGRGLKWTWEAHKGRAVHVRLDPVFLSRVALEVGEVDPARVELQPRVELHDPQVEHLARSLLSEVERPGLGGRLYAESAATLLGVHLLRHHAGAVTPTAGHTLSRGRLRQVLEYIHEHLHTDLALADLARVAHLSPFHFARVFKRAIGVPPHEYVTRERLERARRLLAAAEVPSLAQVARECGFCDQSHLSRQCKRVLGITPNQLRFPDDSARSSQEMARTSNT